MSPHNLDDSGDPMVVARSTRRPFELVLQRSVQTAATGAVDVPQHGDVWWDRVPPKRRLGRFVDHRPSSRQAVTWG